MDVRLLIEKGASVRLVKGAYKEPTQIAFPKKRDVDKNFEELMKSLLLKGNYLAIATHDKRLINEAIRFADEKASQRKGSNSRCSLGLKESFKRGSRIPVTRYGSTSLTGPTGSYIH